MLHIGLPEDITNKGGEWLGEVGVRREHSDAIVRLVVVAGRVINTIAAIVSKKNCFVSAN